MDQNFSQKDHEIFLYSKTRMDMNISHFFNHLSLMTLEKIPLEKQQTLLFCSFHLINNSYEKEIDMDYFNPLDISKRFFTKKKQPETLKIVIEEKNFFFVQIFIELGFPAFFHVFHGFFSLIKIAEISSQFENSFSRRTFWKK